uniref:Uncharacterized protein n=1 Tax=Sphaerodactylus townsendi TaxID=933632 RepID=A0ACB8EC13_9SAUR
MRRRRRRGARGGGAAAVLGAVAVVLALAAGGLLLLRPGGGGGGGSSLAAEAGGAEASSSSSGGVGPARPVYEKPALGLGPALGELGRAARLEPGSERERARQEEGVRRHQINVFLSDRISLHRRLPERRLPRRHTSNLDASLEKDQRMTPLILR